MQEGPQGQLVHLVCLGNPVWVSQVPLVTPGSPASLVLPEEMELRVLWGQWGQRVTQGPLG